MPLVRPVSLVLLSVAALVSCKAIKEAAENVAGQVARQATERPEEGEDMLGLLAKGYNAIIGTVPDAVRSYDSALPLSGEPGPDVRKPVLVAGVLADMKLREAGEAFELARAHAPEKLKHMIPMADDLLGASKEVIAVYMEAKKYYDAEDFNDDSYVKAQLIHAQMKSAVDKYEKSARVFEASIDTEEDKIMLLDLEKYKHEKSYSYYMRFIHFEAKKAVKVVDDPESDLAAVAGATEAFSRACDELKGFVDGQKEPNVTFKAFADSADRYLGSLKRLRRALEVEPQEEEAVRRELDMAISSYNAVISMRNSLAELEQSGLLR